MHAQWIVRRFIDTHLSLMHAARRQLLCAAVAAAMAGHALSLSRLARAVTGSGRLKAALKRIDRLIGCARIEQEVELAARALLAQLSCGGQALVIAVDWSAVAPAGEFVELRAAVTRPGMGRALSVYQRVYPLAKMGNARAERALLEALRAWMRPGDRSEHRHRCGLSAAVVCLRRGAGLDVGSGGCAGACASARPIRSRARWRTGLRAPPAGPARWHECCLGARYASPCDLVLVRRRRVGPANTTPDPVMARSPKRAPRHAPVRRSRGCWRTRGNCAPIAQTRSWHSTRNACRSRRTSATASRRAWAWDWS